MTSDADKITEDLKVSLVVLSQSNILKYCRKISELNLGTLEIRYPKAYDEIKGRTARKILVLTGLYEVAPNKGRGKEDLEIQFTDEAEGPSSYSNINRFREAIIGSQVLEGDEIHPLTWNFDPSQVNTSRFYGMCDIRKFIEALFILVSKDPIKESPIYHGVGDLGSFSTKTAQGFRNICYHLFYNTMKPSEKKIRELLPSICK